MAFRIDKAIVRGEISNEERGIVTGKVWLTGRDEPLVLQLRGNCQRDIAGCRLVFTNLRPEPEPGLEHLVDIQSGVVGDMTGSRKMRIPSVSDQELYDLVARQASIPQRLANSLYLEWYSEINGRVLIESASCQLVVTPPLWSMTPEEEEEQKQISVTHFHEFIAAIAGYGEEDDDESPDDGRDDADGTPEGAGPEVDGLDGHADAQEEGDEDEIGRLDEFEWEKQLRDADRRAEAFQEAYEKYKDHPDRDRLIAEALGWDDEEDDVEEDDEHDGRREPEEMRVEDVTGDELLEAAHDSEGDDAFGTHHPLSQRAMDLALTLQREAEDRGLVADDRSDLAENPIMTLILHVISLGGKLAGGLDGWAQGCDLDPGFVIAMLKRAQLPLNDALRAFDNISLPPGDDEARHWLMMRKRDLFELRREIIDLMQELRTS